MFIETEVLALLHGVFFVSGLTAYSMQCNFITARICSLREGKVFSCVCHSVQRGEPHHRGTPTDLPHRDPKDFFKLIHLGTTRPPSLPIYWQAGSWHSTKMPSCYVFTYVSDNTTSGEMRISTGSFPLSTT